MAVLDVELEKVDIAGLSPDMGVGNIPFDRLNVFALVEPDNIVYAILRVKQETVAVRGIADYFFRIEGITYFGRHSFIRVGMEETATAPKPIDALAKKELPLILRHMHGSGKTLSIHR